MLKLADALAIYDCILEVEPHIVEAHVGKGICLQSQNRPRQAFECFANALRLDARNACALTYCGILYKEEGHLLEAAEVSATSPCQFNAESTSVITTSIEKANIKCAIVRVMLSPCSLSVKVSLLLLMFILMVECVPDWSPRYTDTCNDHGVCLIHSGVPQGLNGRSILQGSIRESCDCAH